MQNNTYQYTVTLTNPERGYTQDEIITVKVAKPAVNTLEIEALHNDEITDYFVVADGKILAENKPASVSVDNEHDVTIYAKPVVYDVNGTDVPRLRLPTGSYDPNDQYRYINSADILTEEEKTFAKDGYYAMRLGRIYERTYVGIDTVRMCRAKIITEGFPEGVQIVQYIKDSFGRYQEQICGEEIIIESGTTVYLKPIWSDPQNAHKWCQLEVRCQQYDITAPYFSSLVTEPGIAGEVWAVQTHGNSDITFELVPHEIKLWYTDGDLSNITPSEGSVLLEDMHTVKVHSGDSPTISFTLDEALNMQKIMATRPTGGDITDEFITYKDEGGGKWTIALNDMSSRLHDSYTSITITATDTKDRWSLSDPSNTVSVHYAFEKVKPLKYTGQPVTLSRLSVSITHEDRLTHRRTTVYLSDSDYTLTYSDNINAGRASLLIKAKPESTLCRGQYTYYFNITKADAFNIPNAHFNIEAGSPQTDLSELVIKGTYDQNVTPTKYTLKSALKGGILESNPVIDGSMVTYSIKAGATKDSAPATVRLTLSFENYKDCELTCVVQLVERETLVLGGTLTADKVYDGKGFVPNFAGLKVLSKEGTAPSTEETAAILSSIEPDMSYRYAGIDGTVYDSDNPPVDVGSYKLQAKVSLENTFYKSDWFDAGTFKITPREAVFTAKDITIYINDTIPVQSEYGYMVEGLVEGDALVKGRDPILSCSVKAEDAAKTGEYPIQLSVVDAAGKTLIQITNPYRENLQAQDVTANYYFTEKPGTLRILEPKLGSCTVIYNLSGKGDDIRRSGITAGSLLPKPVDPEAKGYKFLGWYLDETLAKMWNFSTDTVESDITLYAGWSMEPSTDPDSGMQLYVQEILPQAYTGKAITPAVTVYAADGITPLKKGKDYNVVYKNNTDADTKKFSGQDSIPAGGIGASLTDTAQGFNSTLAYAVITGKGNYTGTVYMNYHISPVDISNADNTSSGITLKYTESFEEKSGKSAAVVTQFKTKKAKLKYGTDYTLTVTKATDHAPVTLNNKGQLPLNSGTYNLVIQGTGNYIGFLEKELYVADKSKLIKNAKITCTGTMPDATKAQLAGGIEAQNLQVTMAGQPLAKDTDYTVTYANNNAIGTATVTVKGINSYLGSKSITFKIKGISFKEKEFDAIALADMTYTGAPLTQNDVKLAKNGASLVYGEDYTVSYKNNSKAGKATMTFTAKPSSGYSGSFKKTFKITPLNLDSDGILLEGTKKNENTSGWALKESVPYQKGGATPSDKLKLRLGATGAVLAENKDYKIKYQNNTTVSEGTASMTLTGKGNFTGSLTVGFDIRKASLSELYQSGIVSITSKPTKVTFSYRSYTDEDGDPQEELRDEDHEFEPAITIKHGKKTLKKGEDFSVSYSGNVRSQLEGGSNSPTATITGIGDYSGGLTEEDTPITIPLSLYLHGLSSSTVYVVYDGNTDFSYTGEPILPKVTVYYGKAADVSKAKKAQETNESILTEEKTEPDEDDPHPDYAYGLTKLREYSAESRGDYIVSYGPNTAKGKNGKVVIQGVYDYGGTATATFNINPKDIYKVFNQNL